MTELYRTCNGPKPGGLATFVLAAAAAITPMLNAVYNSTIFDTERLFFVLLALSLIHVARFPRIVFCREFALYAGFTGYMFLSLLWAPDPALGLNTLLPAVNFLLILTLFGSMASLYDLRTVLTGLLAGFLVGALAFAYLEGFPFVYPKGFSYNAGASMYLFGLFIALLFGLFTGYRVVALLLGAVIMLHIVATTSIKTNLGVVVGAFVAATVFIGQSTRLLLRNFFYIVAVVAGVVYWIASNEAIVATVRSGLDRVALGVAALQARQDVTGRTSIDMREAWIEQGLQGWSTNPVFGYGVEAFRADYGITSHSTPIDLLYNTGLVGLTLYYAIFASIAWRLVRAQRLHSGDLRPLILAALACYVFITLSGTMLYQTFLAIFVALSAVLLGRDEAGDVEPYEPEGRETV